jgi:DNA-binding CsgD family transcriptional regulator
LSERFASENTGRCFSCLSPALLNLGSREVALKKIRKAAASIVDRQFLSNTCTAQFYVFCEKESGAARFQVRAGTDGILPLEEAASLLAMHCLVRGESPSDYQVMVRAADSLFDRVTSKARQLLDAGRAIACPVGLSRREEEVLNGVLESLANKEIASRLSISERTVKFHVSSLFVKFKVRSRIELIRKTPALFANSGTPQEVKATDESLAASPALVPSGHTSAPLQHRGSRIVGLPNHRRLLTA